MCGQKTKKTHRGAHANADVPERSRGVVGKIESRAQVGEDANFGLRGNNAAEVREVPTVAKLEVEGGVLRGPQKFWCEGAKAAGCAEREALGPAAGQSKRASGAGKPR